MRPNDKLGAHQSMNVGYQIETKTKGVAMKYEKLFCMMVWALAIGAMSGCGPTAAVKIIGTEDASDGNGSISNKREINYGGSTYQEPADIFTPKRIEDKSRPAVMAADFNGMPSLILRMGQCYGHYSDEETMAVAGGSAPSVAMPLTRHKESKRRSSSRVKRSPKKSGFSNAKRPAPSAPPPMPSPVEMAQGGPMEDMAAESAAPESNSSYDDKSERIEGDEMQKIADGDVPTGEYEDWGAAIYLSNDDSMSLSSAQRVMFAIDNFLPLPPAHIRPHELLNYFTFDTANVAPGHDFSVYADVAKQGNENGVYSLGLAVAGRPITKDTRRNVALTWVIDRSGSMQSQGRMEYLKRGLLQSVSQLKRGDMVHMVLFDHNVCSPVENFVVGRDSIEDLRMAINALEPEGSTDIHSGLRAGYDIADRSYQGHHSNRVVLVTDALTNTGVTDEDMISMISKYYNSRRIRLSGVGVGKEFNDALLDKLTERGKGAYVFLGSPAEVDAVFGERFISLIETVALDVHFRLHLPRSLRMNVFYGEESSVYKEDVQAIHYFANTSQLFLSDVVARGGAIRPMDDIMLSVEYQDPESGEELVEEYAFNLGEVMKNENYNVKKGRLIMAWIDMLAVMASRTVPSRYAYQPSTWVDSEGYALCEDGTRQLKALAQELQGDGESRRVLQLWEKYCSRYEPPREPIRRDTLRKRVPSWPGARPEEDR